MQDTLVVNNSFCQLKGFPQEVYDSVDTILTYQNDIEAEKNQLFQKIKFLKPFTDSKSRQKLGYAKKQLKDLLASEFVHWLKGDTFPTGHLNIVKDVLAEIYPRYSFIDNRKRPEKRHNFYMREDLPPPRDYQAEMHKLGMREGRGVYVASVGSGKTLVFERLIRDLGVNSLIIVPSVALLTQWQNELEQYFGENNIYVLSSESLSPSKIRKMKKKPIRLVNIQALAALNKKEELTDILEDIEALFFDEIHHAASASYTNLLEHIDHIYHRYGGTGTFVRPDGRTLDMWGVLSTVLYTYSPERGIAEGYLTPIEVFEHELPGVAKKNYQKEFELNYGGEFKKDKNDNVILVKRNKIFLNKIHEIISKIEKPEAQILILVSRKEKTGEVIRDFLKEQGVKCSYISGDDEKDIVNQALKDFNAKKIRILIGSKVIGEGVDVRSTDALILATGGKSDIAVNQAVGRLIRLYAGKKIGHLHDFHFKDTCYQGKHWELRREIYRINFAPKKFHKRCT